MLPGAVSRCPWQDCRVVILPHLVQKSQTAQPCLRMVRQCLVTKGAAHVGVTLTFGSSSLKEQPMQILAFINFPARLTSQEVMGCEEMKHKMLGSYN